MQVRLQSSKSLVFLKDIKKRRLVSYFKLSDESNPFGFCFVVLLNDLCYRCPALVYYLAHGSKPLPSFLNTPICPWGQ